MIVNFRQGIVSYQTLPSYLLLKDGNVYLNTSSSAIVINFADGNANYLFTEARSSTLVEAWNGPFNQDTTYWLYWEINKLSGDREYGYTTVSPSFGSSFPGSPTMDQHFFNTETMKTYYWNGQGWIECIRVFAGSLYASKLTTITLGTQVSVYGPTTTGHILFDVYKKPLKRVLSGSTFEFLTEETAAQPLNYNVSNMGLTENVAIASTFIPQYFCVVSDGADAFGTPKIKKASFYDVSNAAYAITASDINAGEIRPLIYSGFVQNYSWYWDYPPLTPLFVGSDGEITTYVDNPFSTQKIGYVVNLNTIYVEFGPHILRGSNQ